MTPKPTSKLSLIENRGCTNSTTLIVGPAVTGFGVASAFAGSYIIIGVSAGFMGSAYAVASVIGPCKISLSSLQKMAGGFSHLQFATIHVSCEIVLSCETSFFFLAIEH
jgi:hypothetical protein